MAALDLGEVLVRFTADTADLEAGADRAAGAVRQVGQAAEAGAAPLGDFKGKVGEVSGVLGAMGGPVAQAGAAMNSMASSASTLMSGLGPLGIAAGVASVAIGSGVASVVRMGDEMIRLRDRTGLSTDFLQKLKFAADQTGAPFESTTMAVNRFEVSLGKSSKATQAAIAQLGFSFSDLRAMKPEDQFTAIVTALNRIEDPAKQSAIAIQLFGRGGMQMLPLIRNDFAALAEKAEALGIIISEKTLKAGDELGDNWDALKASGKSLLAEALGPFVGRLAEATGQLVNFVAASKEAGSQLERELKIKREASELMMLGVSHSEAMARATEKVTQKEKEVADAVAVSAAEMRSYGEAQAKVAEKTAALTLAAGPSAAARVRMTLATNEASRKEQELANFMEMSLAKFKEMDIGFQKAAGAALHAERIKKAKDNLKSLNDETVLGISKAQASAAAQEIWAQEFIDDFNRVKTEGLEPWKTEYTGVGSLVYEQNKLMTESFRRWGTFTRTESQITADRLRAEFESAQEKGTETAEQLQARWEAYEAAVREADKQTALQKKMSNTEILASTLSTISSMGKIGQIAAIAQSTINVLTALTYALASPWPASIVAFAQVAAMGWGVVSQIKALKFASGTPGLDFMNFGTESPAMLHGNEAVIPKGSGHLLANEIAVQLQARMSAGAGEGSSKPILQNNIVLDGRVLATWMERESKRGAIRTHTIALREF